MRDSLVPVVVALLCVLALGVGAAGLQELTDDADSGPPEVEGDGGESSEEPAQESQASGNDPQRLALDGDTSDACIAGYNQNDLAMLTVVLAIGVSLVATLLTREIMVGAAVLPMVFIPAFVVMLFVFAFLDCPVPAQEAVTNVQNLTGTQNVSGGGNVTAPDNTDSTWGNLRIYGIFGALIVSVFAMALYVQRRNSGDVADARNYQVDAASEEIGEAAGKLADEIEDGVSVSNGVYEAWVEMTDILDLDDPETTTPQEFADAALAAGIEQRDVDELTEIFEKVRYGTAVVTEKREKRALEAFRRIERRYTESEQRNGGRGR